MDYYKKYIKYKSKYIASLKHSGGTQTEYSISGPASITLISIPEHNKKMILLGDVHYSYHNTCYFDASKTSVEINRRCKSDPRCLYVTDFLDKVFDHHAERGDKVDFFLEDIVFFDTKSKFREMVDSILSEKREAFYPIEAVELKYMNCLVNKEDCPSGARIHSCNPRIGLDFHTYLVHIYTVLTIVSKHIDTTNIRHRASSRELLSKESVNLIVDLQYTIDKIAEYFSELTIDNLSLHNDNYTIPVIMKQIKKTDKLPKILHDDLNRNIQRFLRSDKYINSVKSSYEDFLYKLNGLKTENKFTFEDYLKDIDIPATYDFDTLYYNLNTIYTFLTLYWSSIQDLYMIHRMFGVTKNEKQYDKIIAYIGDGHIWRLIDIFSGLKSASIVFTNASLEPSIDPLNPRPTNRCHHLDISIEDLMNFNF